MSSSVTFFLFFSYRESMCQVLLLFGLSVGELLASLSLSLLSLCITLFQLSIYQSLSFIISLPLSLSMYLSMYIFIHLYGSMTLFISRSLSPSLSLSMYLSMYIFIHLYGSMTLFISCLFLFYVYMSLRLFLSILSINV